MKILQSYLDDISNSPITKPLIASLFVLLAHRLINAITLHPLSHIPGLYIARITPLWLWYHSYIGDQATVIHTLHKKYGPIVLVSPNEVDISDPAAINPIYISRGGFLKAPCYVNFDIDGHHTIFSTIEPEHRALRARAVAPLFSTKAIKENEWKLYECVDRMVDRMKEDKISQGRVDVLNLARSLGIDIVSTHLFQKNYNGVSEKGESLSASAFVDTFVAAGRFFCLPNWLFSYLGRGTEMFLGDVNTATSFEVVDKFVDDLVSQSVAASDGNYPARLLQVGLSKMEVKAQCKDLIFAGTDSTGTNLAVICRQLALNPDKYERLYKELILNAKAGPIMQKEIKALPYLSAVIREGLRISMAVPTRLPRVVPSSGWTHNNIAFPPNTRVGCAAHSLHFSDEVFPEPHAFKPERWLEDVSTEMDTSFFAWGSGPRACIARNLATTELYMATERVVLSGVLKDAKAKGEIEIFEWFNGAVKSKKAELIWD